MKPLKIVVLGLSLTSSWGNGHATTYRALIRALAERGHDLLFLERDVRWYAANRDLPTPSFCRLGLYSGLAELIARWEKEVAEADLVVVGSYVPQGVMVGQWVSRVAEGVTAFYDIDTPVTLAKLDRGDEEYLSRDLIPEFDLYLSFCGGPALRRLEMEFGARMARPLHCCADPLLYGPEEVDEEWDLGYLGTYSTDRQPALERLLLEPARGWPRGRFVVAGSQYPVAIAWPPNVGRIEHLPPAEHRRFYNQQRFALNVTRADMIAAGYSPSVRLFEAAACGTAIISDYWEGLETFFQPDREILIAHSSGDILEYLTQIPAAESREIGARAAARVQAEHTAARRAVELEDHYREVLRTARTATMTSP